MKRERKMKRFDVQNKGGRGGKKRKFHSVTHSLRFSDLHFRSVRSRLIRLCISVS
ncbi:unnamed protein product [Sphenostylis stenocarpa]|uniref:Uncharacterized protein n=1 Tax=Sphenostylis stenocarpa TaxID=92480 RepID=A0AA86VA45_9FABA|nr:unnamed protein product [Sphenostylis stenocarpa]